MSIRDKLNDDLLKACNKGDLNMVKQLLSQGANIEYEETGFTPLSTAAFYGHLNIVKYLLSKGSNINVMTVKGYTPLILASFRNKKDIVKYLIKHGDNLKMKNINGHTCLHFSGSMWKSYEMQKLILSKNLSWYSELTRNNIPIHPKIKEEYPEESISDELGFFEGINKSQQYDLNRQLLIACDKGDLNAVKQSIEEGADINCHYNPDFEYLKTWICLINRNMTPLMISLWSHGANEVTSFLISLGVDIEAKDNNGTNCFGYGVHSWFR